LFSAYRTAIAHCIREQVQTYQKSLFLIGHPSDGSPIQDDDLRSSFLPSLTCGARAIDQVPSFTPLLNYLSDGELEKNEKDRDKDLNKRRKRYMRSRRGLALPDREPIRTYRTPGIGFPELDAATLALTAAASAPTSRRAAAAAASLTIANMVASENGTALMPMQAMPMMSSQPVPATSSNEKKPKGLFKAPSYPSSILRPRARVTAPTPSTALDVASIPAPHAPVENESAPSSTAAAGTSNSSSSATVVAPPPDSKAVRVLTAKQVKELEKEAKEKEYADSQHANFINGVWHCSNCGCPENIAIGRRKGPLGDKSQCGPCGKQLCLYHLMVCEISDGFLSTGKFWHRHRRPLPVQYSSDPEFHLNLKRETELVKPVVVKKKGPTSRGQGAASSTADEGPAESHTPTRRRGGGEAWTEPGSRSSPPPVVPPTEDDRAISPISTASSSSEPPLAQRFQQKVNGADKGHSGLSSSSSLSSGNVNAGVNTGPASTSSAVGNGEPARVSGSASSTSSGRARPGVVSVGFLFT
jgi:SWI/SNF-related matrix-associated actin-dependent regulator of chromatin subfamily B protein 1